MIELAQNAESHELSGALEKLGREAARLQTVIDTVPSFLWTSFPDGSKEYLNKQRDHRVSAAPIVAGSTKSVSLQTESVARLSRCW